MFWKNRSNRGMKNAAAKELRFESLEEMRSRKSGYKTGSRSTRLGIEPLESRQLLAIVWANETDAGGGFDPSNGFANTYNENAQIARLLVKRAPARRTAGKQLQ